MAVQVARCLIILLLLNSCLITVFSLRTYLMPLSCTGGKKKYVKLGSIFSGGYSSSGILELSSYSSQSDCSTVLQPYGSSTISITALELNLRFNNKITFSDGSSSVVINGWETYFKGTNIFTSSPGKEVTVYFQAYGVGAAFGGFKVVFTEFQTGYDCDSFSTYTCDNGRCIADGLDCDGYNHCGDFSSNVYCGPSTGAIFGYVIASVFFAILLLLLICACTKRKSRRNNLSSLGFVIHPPPSARPMVNPTVPTSNYQSTQPITYSSDPPPYSTAVTEKENPMYQ